MTAGWCGCRSACQASPRLAPCWGIPPLGWHCSRAAGGAPSWGRCVHTSPLEAGLSAVLCTRALSFSLEQPQEVGMSPAGGAPAAIPRPFVSLAPCAGARLGAEQQRAASTCLLPRSPQSPTFSLSPGLKPHKMPVCSVRLETLPAQEAWTLSRGLSWAQTPSWPAEHGTLGRNSLLGLTEPSPALQESTQAAGCVGGARRTVSISSCPAGRGS